MDKHKILILCLSRLKTDPRIIKQYEALSSVYEIETMGYSALNDDVVHYNMEQSYSSLLRKIMVRGLILTRMFDLLNWLEKKWRISKELRQQRYDFILCNELKAMPIAVELSKKNDCPIWLDLHEYYPEQNEGSASWRRTFKPQVVHLAKNYLHQAKVRSTVCEPICKKYEEVFGTEVSEVITNATFYVDNLKPFPVGSKIKLVHHGGAIRNRKLEGILDLMDHLPEEDYTLDFMLAASNVDQKKYLQELKAKYEQKLNINFVQAVHPTEIAAVINKYDIGIYILKPGNFNESIALPNKFFEFVQARLAVAVSPNPEMKRYVEKYEVGVVADDYTQESMAEKLLSLNKEKLSFYKEQSHKHASELSFDSNKKVMLRIAEELLT